MQKGKESLAVPTPDQRDAGPVPVFAFADCVHLGKESLAVPTRDFPDLFRAPGGAPTGSRCHRKGQVLFFGRLFSLGQREEPANHKKLPQWGSFSFHLVLLPGAAAAQCLGCHFSLCLRKHNRTWFYCPARQRNLAVRPPDRRYFRKSQKLFSSSSPRSMAL